MLDLRSMSDDEFSILVTPSVPQAAMYVRIEENGRVLLSSKVAEKFSKVPLQIRFNKDCNAIQIATALDGAKNVLFPKNGTKVLPDAAAILKRNHISLPAVFDGYVCEENTKWRGALRPNPTARPLPTTRGTKKK